MRSYIGCSTSPDIRRKATSGGVGTAIIKYLLDSHKVDYALTFEYNQEKRVFRPRIISDYKDYNICGSIYQEINLVQEVKTALDGLAGGGKICITCLSCQAKALRAICSRMGFEAVIIGLACSSQQSPEATSYLYKRIGIVEKEVRNLQYWGNGWPSGTQIQTNDDGSLYVSNNGSIWTEIFHSRIFIQKRCFKCNNT